MSTSTSTLPKSSSTSGTKKIEKFGTQATKAKVVYVFSNGDKHHKGTKITLKPNKTFDQILQEFTTSVGVPTGAVRQVFTTDGKSIKKLEEFEDQGRYVCAGAEKFLKDLLSPAATAEASEAPAEPKPKPVKKSTEPKKPTVSAYSKSGGVTKFGTQTEKAKVIYVYRNNDKHHQGVKVTVHPTKFKTWDQLKEHLTREVKLNTGAVMKLYTTDGKAVKDFESLEDETKYVATGPEKFTEFVGKVKEEKPAEPEEKEKSEEKEKPAEQTEQKEDAEKTEEKKEKKEIQKFGMQTEKAKVIYVFRNGDKHHKGAKITVHPTKYKSMDQLKDTLNKEVGVPTGSVLKIYTVTGALVKELKDIEDGGKYVCAGAEKFNKELLSPVATDEAAEAPVKAAPAPKKKEDKKPTVGAYAKDGVKKFGMQTEKAKVIYVFRHGDKHHTGTKITVHQTKYKTFDQLKETLSKQVSVVTGPVRQVFTKDGKLVKTLEELEDEGKYVAAGAEKFDAAKVSPNINKEFKRSSSTASGSALGSNPGSTSSVSSAVEEKQDSAPVEQEEKPEVDEGAKKEKSNGEETKAENEEVKDEY